MEECCICNDKEHGEFITYNGKKYHLECIEDLVEDILPGLNNRIDELEAEIKEDNDAIGWWHNRFKAVQRDYEKGKELKEFLIDYIKALEIDKRIEKHEILDIKVIFNFMLEKLEGKEEEK